jgi:hypothetical protein
MTFAATDLGFMRLYFINNLPSVVEEWVKLTQEYKLNPSEELLEKIKEFLADAIVNNQDALKVKEDDVGLSLLPVLNDFIISRNKAAESMQQHSTQLSDCGVQVESVVGSNPDTNAENTSAKVCVDETRA